MKVRLKVRMVEPDGEFGAGRVADRPTLISHVFDAHVL